MAPAGLTQVVIAGGGIGGLAAALACAQQGVAVQLIERATQFSEVGAGIQIGPNVTRILQAWGLEDGLNRVAAFPKRLQARDAQTGQVLGSLRLGERAQALYGAPYATIHRADLQAMLHTAVQAAGVDVLVTNHPIHMAATEKEALIRYGATGGANPFIYGVDKYQRYMGVMSACSRVQLARMGEAAE